MIQKTTWMRYLLLGISGLIIIGYSSCNKRTEGDFKEGTYIYRNNTNLSIEVKGAYNFIIGSSQTHKIRTAGEGAKYLTYKSYTPPFGGAIIKFDNIICDTIGNISESILNIENYANEKIAERHYKSPIPLRMLTIIKGSV